MQGSLVGRWVDLVRFEYAVRRFTFRERVEIRKGYTFLQDPVPESQRGCIGQGAS